MQFRLAFSSRSFSFSLPLSKRLVVEEPLTDRVWGPNDDLGGDPDAKPVEEEPVFLFDEFPTFGSESLYHPPVNVRAIS